MELRDGAVTLSDRVVLTPISGRTVAVVSSLASFLGRVQGTVCSDEERAAVGGVRAEIRDAHAQPDPNEGALAQVVGQADSRDERSRRGLGRCGSPPLQEHGELVATQAGN